jgi:hypothetical protein
VKKISVMMLEAPKDSDPRPLPKHHAKGSTQGMTGFSGDAHIEVHIQTVRR